jgi:ATP-dependent RNA helicase RhlE
VPESITNQPSFYGLGIAPKLMDAIAHLKFTVPTPIQRKAIPLGIEGKDLIGIAQTGTGKTLAFGVPMIQRLAQVKGRGLVLLPTRELAVQVEETLQRVGKLFGLRTVVLIGGASMYNQIKALSKNPHILIATPGRLLDHMEQKHVKLGDIRILVLDEADRMLDMGFAPQINRILSAVPRSRQTMLFSATMPGEIVSIAQKHMQLPVRVEVARSGATIEKVIQEVFVVGRNQKDRLLEKLLLEFRGTVLVFTRTKFTAKKLARAVKSMGHSAADIHSNRSLAQRRDALEGFKAGRYRVLVATDIAARGIDVTGIELVVNYDLPATAEDYVHRIGRTGRAGQPGHAIAFATPDQERDVRAIERLIRASLRVRPLPHDLPPARSAPPHEYEREARPPNRSFGRPQRRGRGGGPSSGGSFGGRGRRARRPNFRNHF